MKKHTKQIFSGVILFVVGAIIVPALFFGSLVFYLLTEKSIAKFIIPAKTEVAIEKEGRYYVWNEYQTIFEGKTYSSSEELPGGLEISLVDTKNGNAFEFVSDQSITSSTGNSQKNAIGYFEIERPGEYTLSVSGETSPRVFSFGKSFLNANSIIIALIVFPIEMLIGIGGFVLIIIGIINLVKDYKQKKSASSAPAVVS